MGKGYPRFRKELLRAKESNTKIILVVECPLNTFLKGNKNSTKKVIKNGKIKYIKLTKEEREKQAWSYYKKIITLWVKYDLCPIFCKNREEIQTLIMFWFFSAAKEKLKARREKNEDKK